MKRIIKTNNNFCQYVDTPLIPSDVNSYMISWDIGSGAVGASLKVTAKRSDGAVIEDVGEVDSKGTATYTLKNNMYAAEGELTLRLTAVQNGEVLTDKELIFDVSKAWDEATIEGDDRVPALSTLINQVNALKNDGNIVKDENYVHTDNNYTDLQKLTDELIANNVYIGRTYFRYINSIDADVFSINLLGASLTSDISVGDLLGFLDHDTFFVRIVNKYPAASVTYSSYDEFAESIVANKKVRLGLFDVELFESDVDLTQIERYVNTVVYLAKNAVSYPTKEDLTDYATKEDLTDYATKETLTVYPTKEEMNTAIVEGDPKYELIQTIMVEDNGVTEFTFNVDSNGDTFKLDAIVVRLECPTTPNTTNYWRVGTTSSSSTCFHYFKPDNGGDVIILKSERICKNFWFGLRSRNSSTSANCPIYTSQSAYAVDYAENIYMQFKGIPLGTIITVCGRRVNK